MKKLTLIPASLLVAACGGGGGGSVDVPPVPPETTVDFEVTVVNLTNAQPLSPPGVVVHEGAFRVFEVGTAATVGLEELAEGGDPAALLAEADGQDGVLQTLSFDGPVPPGATSTSQFTVVESELRELSVSVATMLVNTNDAFTAVNSAEGFDQMAPGSTVSFRTIAYDAGTEADTEAPGTIPGPADGGEGFNADRDDEFDRVSMHGGVVSASAGLATSRLTDQHRFDNPVAEIRITRLN